MEVQQCPAPQEATLLEPIGAILSLKVVDNGQLLAAFDSAGEAHLYSRLRDKWTHRFSTKLFESPIVASDMAYHLGIWELVVVDFGGTFKFCKLSSELQVIVTSQVKINLRSPIVSCLFYGPNDRILATTESGFLVIINLTTGTNETVEISTNSTPALVRVGNSNSIYVTTDKTIVNYEIDTKEISEFLQLEDRIVDFTVSPDEIYSSLIVLTEKRILFYVQTPEQMILTTQFKLETKALCSKLGWGKNYEQLGLYQSQNGFINTRCFYKMQSGKWVEEESQLRNMFK